MKLTSIINHLKNTHSWKPWGSRNTKSILDQFNIFEAMGAVHVEVRHSEFLSFLLDPYQNHGLGDTF